MAGVTSLAGRYELRRVIGRGGMGAVWAARDHAEQRDVAVKIAGPQPGAAARLRREAELTAAVTHPGVVGVRDAGEDAGTTFLVLDLLRGPDLGQVLRRGPVPAPDAVRLAAEVADALAAAHAVGVVHGDVSPANVVLAEEEAVLVDFGAACRTRAAAGRTTVGTAPYMAPEQVTAQRLGPGADVYALGCLVTASLAGRPRSRHPRPPASSTATCGPSHRGCATSSAAPPHRWTRRWRGCWPRTPPDGAAQPTPGRRCGRSSTTRRSRGPPRWRSRPRPGSTRQPRSRTSHCSTPRPAPPDCHRDHVPGGTLVPFRNGRNGQESSPCTPSPTVTSCAVSSAAAAWAGSGPPGT